MDSSNKLSVDKVKKMANPFKNNDNKDIFGQVETLLIGCNTDSKKKVFHF